MMNLLLAAICDALHQGDVSALVNGNVNSRCITPSKSKKIISINLVLLHTWHTFFRCGKEDFH
jgi:hypothetical protein